MISSAVKIVPGMQLRLFTWKGGEDIDIAVIPEEPGPPHALLQFAFKGVQLNLLQQRVLICGYQEAAPIILHPPEARPPILPLVHVSPKVAGNQLVILVHAVRCPDHGQVLAAQAVEPCAVAEMDACRIQPPDISPVFKHLESDYFQVLLPGHIPYIKKERENITFQSISYQGSFVCILTTPISFATTPHYTTDPLKYIEF